MANPEYNDSVRCLSVFAAAFAVALTSADAYAGEPAMEKLDLGAAGTAVFYAPRAQSPRKPIVAMLHGMCATPEWECPVFRGGAARHSFLLCPPGPARCRGAGRMRVFSTKKLATVMDSAIAELELRRAAEVDSTRRALVGYSLGATAALRLALAQPQRWRALMIVNASITPAAKDLQRAGIERIALVAGDHDRSSTKLRRAAARLKRAGVDARYFSMGKVGHYFDASTESRLVEPLEWLQAELGR